MGRGGEEGGWGEGERKEVEEEGERGGEWEGWRRGKGERGESGEGRDRGRRDGWRGVGGGMGGMGERGWGGGGLGERGDASCPQYISSSCMFVCALNRLFGWVSAHYMFSITDPYRAMQCWQASSDN